MPNYFVSAISDPIPAKIYFSVESVDKEEAINEAQFLIRSGQVSGWYIGENLVNYSMPLRATVKRATKIGINAWSIYAETVALCAIAEDTIVANSAEEARTIFDNSIKTWFWGGFQLDFFFEAKPDRVRIASDNIVYNTKINITEDGSPAIIGVPKNLTINVSYIDLSSGNPVLNPAPGSIELDGVPYSLTGGSVVVPVIPDTNGFINYNVVYVPLTLGNISYKTSSNSIRLPIVLGESTPVSLSTGVATIAKGNPFPLYLTSNNDKGFSFKVKAYPTGFPSNISFLYKGYSTTSSRTIMVEFDIDNVWPMNMEVFIEIDRGPYYNGADTNAVSIIVT